MSLLWERDDTRTGSLGGVLARWSSSPLRDEDLDDVRTGIRGPDDMLWREAEDEEDPEEADRKWDGPWALAVGEGDAERK